MSRSLYVNDWGSPFATVAGIAKIIQDAKSVLADTIYVQLTSQYIEAVTDATKASWADAGNTFNGMTMLDYFIQAAHSAGLRIHAWMSINIVNQTADAEYRLFGPSAGYLYNVVQQSGTKITTIPYRIDMSNTAFQDYEADLMARMVARFPGLDGLHVEEPLVQSFSYSPAVRSRVLAKFGYDILSPGALTTAEVQTDISAVQIDATNEIFQKIKLATQQINPNFLISANSWIIWPDLTKAYGIDPISLAQNHFIDFYSLQMGGTDLAVYFQKAENLRATIGQYVPVEAVAYPYWNDWANGTKPPNPSFFDEVRYACDHGADGVAIFAWHWLEQYTGGVLGTQNIIQTLASIPVCGADPPLPGPEPVPPGPVPVDPSLINAGFEDGTLTGWTGYSDVGNYIGIASPGNNSQYTAIIDISASSANTQLYQSGLVLAAGGKYTLSFDARVSLGDQMEIRLINHNAPYENLGVRELITLSDQWQRFTIDFTSLAASQNARLQFMFGGGMVSAQYYIDNVQLEVFQEPVPPEPPAPVHQPVAVTEVSIVPAGIISVTDPWTLITMVKNNNDYPVQNVEVRYYSGEDLIDTFTIFEIQANGSHRIEKPFPPQPEGQYIICVRTDQE